MTRRLRDVELNLKRLTREHVEAVVQELGPDAAFSRLGISRATLYRWLRRWRRERAEAEMRARLGAIARRTGDEI